VRRRFLGSIALCLLLALPVPARALVPRDGATLGNDAIVDAKSTKKKKAGNAALIAGGVGGAMLLGAVIANAQRPAPQVVVVQPPPPPPVIVQQAPPPAPVAQPQPQMLPPNCQHVLQTIQVQGIAQPQQALSVACRQPDGSWVYR